MCWSWLTVSTQKLRKLDKSGSIWTNSKYSLRLNMARQCHSFNPFHTESILFLDWVNYLGFVHQILGWLWRSPVFDEQLDYFHIPNNFQLDIFSVFSLYMRFFFKSLLFWQCGLTNIISQQVIQKSNQMKVVPEVHICPNFILNRSMFFKYWKTFIMGNFRENENRYEAFRWTLTEIEQIHGKCMENSTIARISKNFEAPIIFFTTET